MSLTRSNLQDKRAKLCLTNLQIANELLKNMNNFKKNHNNIKSFTLIRYLGIKLWCGRFMNNKDFIDKVNGLQLLENETLNSLPLKERMMLRNIIHQARNCN